MDPVRFDALSRSLTIAGSRRRVVATLAGALGALGLAPADMTEARKKACPPCKKRKRGKCKKNLPDGIACAGGTCHGGSCVPAAPGPVTTADAACPGPYATSTGSPQVAQTFRALRSG